MVCKTDMVPSHHTKAEHSLPTAALASYARLSSGRLDKIITITRRYYFLLAVAALTVLTWGCDKDLPTASSLPEAPPTTTAPSSSPVEPLSVRFSAEPRSGPAPLKVAFVAQVTGGSGAYRFSWQFGDGQTSETQNPSHEYRAQGKNRVSVKVTSEREGIVPEELTNSEILVINVLASGASTEGPPPNSPSPERTLAIAKTGAGTGTVTSNPAGIQCGGDCTEPYARGTAVVLTATPNAGSTFAGWSGACSGSGTCTVTLNDDASVTASFALATATLFRLDVAKAGTGTGTVTSSPAGINCGADCTEDYANGTPVTLTATADAGSVFAGWSGACSGTGTCSVTMSQARSVTATFNLQVFTLSVAVAGAGSGTVTSSPAGINCGADCTEDYASGTPVTLTATPDAGSVFSGWGGACSGTGTCSVSMTQARSVTATFTLPATYTLTVSVTSETNGKGRIDSTPSGIDNCKDSGNNANNCVGDFSSGSTVTLTATTVGAGSFLKEWTGACAGVPATTSTCTLTMNGAQTAGAVFKK